MDKLSRGADPRVPVAPWPAQIQIDQLDQCLSDLFELLGSSRTSLLQLLIGVQQQYGWVPPHAIDVLASKLQISHSEVVGVIDFYSFLSEQYQGQYRILLSSNITDLMLGQPELLEAFSQALGVKPGSLRSDGRVSLATTSCSGMCEQGPAALINGLPIPFLDQDKITQIAELIEAQAPFSAWPSEWFEIDSGIRHRDWLLSEHPVGEALDRALQGDEEGLLDQLDESGLRGRGGAGFITYRKLWNTSHEGPKNLHYLICNADEGEPGTFKDRVLLQFHADDLFEGMTLAAWTIKAHTGFLYLRGEYAYLLKPLQATLQRRRKQGLLGKSIRGIDGFDFDIQIHLGAGAYVCGEESALIESLEGKRGIPRIRPPFPDTNGYLGQPTLVNNVETFCCVSQIARTSGAEFAAKGTAGSSGTKLHSISGDCQSTGCL